MIVAGNAWVFLLYYLCGRLSGLPGGLPTDAVGWFFGGILGGIVVCCVQLAVSMVIRSFAVPIGIGLAGSIGGMVFTTKGMGLFFPYSLYSIGMRANNPKRALDTKVFMVSCIAYILLFSVVSVAGLRRHEQ